MKNRSTARKRSPEGRRCLFTASVLVVVSLPSLVWADWPFVTEGFGNVSSPAIADIDGDGFLEIVFGSYDGNVYCVDPTGQELWRTYVSGLSYDTWIQSSP